MAELACPDTGLKALTRLNLADTGVTDAGLVALARPDTGLKALAELTLPGTATTKAVATLRAARPQLNIIERSTRDSAARNLS